MFSKPSLMTRLAVGKGLGFVFGLLVFFGVRMAAPETDVLFLWGLLFYCTITGAFIGLMGVVTYHPVLRMPMPWWFRAPLVGGFMTLVLWFLAPAKIDAIVIAALGPDNLFINGPWVVLDGIVLGLIIGGLATMLGGEGKMDMVDESRN